MIIVGNPKHYDNITLILEKTCLKYIKNNHHFDNLSITFYVRSKADIFMSHGCADKNYRETMKCKYLSNFKLILVPGPWLKKKLINLGVDESKIACVGWPKLDPLFVQKEIYMMNRNKYNTNNLKTILWAPTHNSGQRRVCVKKQKCIFSSISSYPDLHLYIDHINKIKGIKIITSKHPRNTQNKKLTFDKLVTCDYVIADSGSTIYEAWALGKPVIFPDWIVKNNINKTIAGSAEDYIYKNKIGYHPNNINQFVSLLKRDLIIGDDVKKFMEEYMPSRFNGISGKIILYEISKRFNVPVVHNIEHFTPYGIKNKSYGVNLYIFISIIFLIIMIKLLRIYIKK